MFEMQLVVLSSDNVNILKYLKMKCLIVIAFFNVKQRTVFCKKEIREVLSLAIFTPYLDQHS